MPKDDPLEKFSANTNTPRAIQESLREHRSRALAEAGQGQAERHSSKHRAEKRIPIKSDDEIGKGGQAKILKSEVSIKKNKENKIYAATYSDGKSKTKLKFDDHGELIEIQEKAAQNEKYLKVFDYRKLTKPEERNNKSEEIREEFKKLHKFYGDKIHLCENKETGELSILMPKIPGESLASYLKKDPGLSQEKLLKIMIGMIDQVQKCHNLGIIHRDINPNNFMIEEKEGKIFIYLIDFGMAKNKGENAKYGGTPEFVHSDYLPNEKILKYTDTAEDIIKYENQLKNLPNMVGYHFEEAQQMCRCFYVGEHPENVLTKEEHDYFSLAISLHKMAEKSPAGNEILNHCVELQNCKNPDELASIKEEMINKVIETDVNYQAPHRVVKRAQDIEIEEIHVHHVSDEYQTIWKKGTEPFELNSESSSDDKSHLSDPELGNPPSNSPRRSLSFSDFDSYQPTIFARPIPPVVPLVGGTMLTLLATLGIAALGIPGAGPFIILTILVGTALTVGATARVEKANLPPPSP